MEETEDQHKSEWGRPIPYRELSEQEGSVLRTIARFSIPTEWLKATGVLSTWVRRYHKPLLEQGLIEMNKTESGDTQVRITKKGEIVAEYF